MFVDNVAVNNQTKESMKASEIFPSKYLKAEDLGDDEPTVTIEKVAIEELESKDRGKQEKPVIYFKGIEKAMVCNKTNWSLIARQHGDESDDWTGKQITLFVMDVEAFGEIVSAIRVRPPKKTAATSVAANVQGLKTGAQLEANGELITKYWTLAKQLGYSRKQGLDNLQTAGGDFETAIKVLESGDIPF